MSEMFAIQIQWYPTMIGYKDRDEEYIIYYSTTSYSRVASIQESKKQAWLSSGVDFDMR